MEQTCSSMNTHKVYSLSVGLTDLKLSMRIFRSVESISQIRLGNSSWAQDFSYQYNKMLTSNNSNFWMPLPQFSSSLQCVCCSKRCNEASMCAIFCLVLTPERLLASSSIWSFKLPEEKLVFKGLNTGLEFYWHIHSVSVFSWSLKKFNVSNTPDFNSLSYCSD